MKRTILYIFCALIIASCATPKKLYTRGYYDAAIVKLVKKLKKKPNKQKNIDLLVKAYENANREDTENITFWKKEGKPDNWEKIYEAYDRLKRRQSLVKTLPRLVNQDTRRVIQFEFVDYDQEIIQYKQKAAEYLYAKAARTLESGGRVNARMAFEDLSQVKGYYPNFKDVDKLLAQAQEQGTSHVLFTIENKTRVLLPPDFEREVKKITLEGANRQWIEFDVNRIQGKQYDYDVVLNIHMIDVSPERVKETRFTESKEVEDGWEYQLDRKGNVMKDSLGNDIKIPKFKVISCDVVESLQLKDATMKGRLGFYDNISGQHIKSLPVAADAHFEHMAVAAFGNRHALKPETKKRIGNEPIPFPDDFGMLMLCADIMKDEARRKVSAYRGLLD